ncbi:MAG: PH domain-containing protein [Halobacteriota archaeon]|uniref:PH domain-containing protein n=1 Tax=Halodesulfurarchaeum sp. HSR-GB TaxID=3074077 RepID=UPI0028650CCA|nr:PH domain-containing protein [Halodesulfurarchaeum sp. HSR-GB]MDR5657147.1 PH domain-containing protein [Halodesulfurarchaeum sp. HSR-GB]
MERLTPRVQILWGVVAVLLAAVLAGVLAGVTFWFEWRFPTAAIGAFLLLAVLLLGHAHLRFRLWRYELQDDALFLHRGVFTRVRTVVPYVRVQHVDTQRNPFERALGLSRVVVYTAGSRGADVRIPGLKPDRAESLQERLRALAGEHEADDGV